MYILTSGCGFVYVQVHIGSGIYLVTYVHDTYIYALVTLHTRMHYPCIYVCIDIVNRTENIGTMYTQLRVPGFLSLSLSLPLLDICTIHIFMCCIRMNTVKCRYTICVYKDYGTSLYRYR